MTPAQERVLRALRAATIDGWPATVRDVMERSGHSSPSSTHRLLHTLAEQGLARQHPRNQAGGWLPT